MNLLQLNCFKASGAILLMLFISVCARPVLAQDKVEPSESITVLQKAKYLNGGVGDSQAKAMRAEAGSWSLRIIFSQLKANEYISGVNLSITDVSGAQYLLLDTAGPLTYVALPPGKYRVTATHTGQSQIRQITISGSKSSDLNFHWKGVAKADPFDGKPLGGNQVPG